MTTSSSSSTSSKVPAGTYVSFQPVAEKKVQLGGKTYEITKLRQRVGGKEGTWQEVDISKLSSTEKEKLIDSAITAAGIFEKLDDLPVELKSAHTFTLRFHQELDSGPGFIHSTIGRAWKRFAWKPEPKILEEISYKESKNSKEKTFKVDLHKYNSKDQEDLLTMTRSLASDLQKITEKHLANVPLKKLKKPQPTPIETSKTPLDTALSSPTSAASAIALIMKSRGDTRETTEIIHGLKDKYQKTEVGNDKSDFFLTVGGPTIILKKDEDTFKVKETVNLDPVTSFKNLSLQDFQKFNIVLCLNEDNYQAVIPTTPEHVTALQSILN